MVDEKSPKEYTAEEFAKEYKDLCDKMGYGMVVIPQYMSRDDGTFSTVLQYQVSKTKE